MSYEEALKMFTQRYWDVLIVFLFLAGMYFTIKTRGVQFRRLGFLLLSPMRYLSVSTGKSGIHAYQAFFTHLGVMVGSGTIFGVAVGLYLGGPGAIFWMWMYALFGMAIACAENTLAQYYKKRSEMDPTKFIGGPSFYLKYGAKLPLVGTMIAAAYMLITPVSVGLHSNFIVGYFVKAFSISRFWGGLIMAVLVALVIIGGIKRIAQTSTYMMPISCFLYIGLCTYVIIVNFTMLPGIFMWIFKSAFGFDAAVGGFSAGILRQAINLGCRRSMYSNGAGQGTPTIPIAAGEMEHPAQGGFVSMLSTFVDTIILCTGTALVILTSGVDITTDVDNSGGAMLIDAAIVAHMQMGQLPTYFMCAIMFLLVYTTIIGIYYSGETQLRYVKDRTYLVYISRCAHVFTVFYFAVAQTVNLVRVIDIMMATLTTLNLVALYYLCAEAVKLINDYDDQIAKGEYIPKYQRDWGILKKSEIHIHRAAATAKK